MTNTKKVAKVKKVDVKKAAKLELAGLFKEFLEAKGIEYNENYEDFNFTQGTTLVHMDKTDVQVKLITPKHGLERYPQVVIEYVEELEEEVEVADEEVEG